MIYKREEFFEDNPNDPKFPVKQIEQIVSLDGSTKKYIGRVSLGLQTPMGVTSVPITFEIDAPTIQEAFQKFGQMAETEIERAKAELQNELQEMRRQSQSRIITPGEMNPGDLGKLKL